MRREILAAQSVDHGVTIVVSSIFLMLSLNLFSINPNSLLFSNSASFWIGFLGFTVWIGFLYRSLAYVLFGNTLGAELLKLRLADRHAPPAQMAFGMFVESLGVALPLLWIFDYWVRKQSPSGLSLRYVYDYSA